jgi:hypothetical protein
MKKIKITESQLKRLVLKEQGLKNIGNKIKAGVQGVVDKVKGVTQNKEVPQPGKPDKGRDLEQLRTEWSKINQDTSNMRGYGEAVGQKENSVRTVAMMKAKTAILKKLNKPQARFGSIIVDEALFQLENDNYIKLVVLELTKVWEDGDVVKLNESDLTRLVKIIVENISTEGIPQEDLDALRAEAQKMVDNARTQALKRKEELDRLLGNIRQGIENGTYDSSVESVLNDYVKEKEREFEYYNKATVEGYMEGLVFEYKRNKAHEDYEREKIERRKTKKITKKDIINLFVTALEGGSNYWYYLPEIPGGVREIMNDTGMMPSEAIGEYVLRGGNIQVNDAEEEDEVLGTVDMGSLIGAIEKLKEDYPERYYNIIDEEYDAEDADIFFQLATMGDVVFG